MMYPSTKAKTVRNATHIDNRETVLSKSIYGDFMPENMPSISNHANDKPPPKSNLPFADNFFR